MILAFHSIFSCYGFWLPNDPRGSGSDYIANWELFRFGGPATRVNTRHSVAARPHDHQHRIAAKQTLKYPPARMTGIQALTVSTGFIKAIDEAAYRVHACAILPDHVHLVIGWDARNIRTIVAHFKSKATSALRKARQWGETPLWSAHGWNVYLDDLAQVKRAIAYVEANPEKEGKPRQHWSFVTPFQRPPRRTIPPETPTS